MANSEIDEVPVPLEMQHQLSDDSNSSPLQSVVSRTRSASISIPMGSMESHENIPNLVGYTGPLRSEKRTPFSQTGGPPYIGQRPEKTFRRNRAAPGSKFHNALYGDAKGWARRSFSYVIPSVMNPHANIVQQWNKFFDISCWAAVFMDSLFFFLLSVQKDNMCIISNQPMTTTLVVLRSMTDFIYLLHILLQFRMAYIAPRVVGAGDLVDGPKAIALHYLRGNFFIDLLVAFPLPQILTLLVVPTESLLAAKYALLLAGILPRIYKVLSLLPSHSPTSFAMESAWGYIVVNLLMFVLAGHIVGSCWYLLGLQRVNQCLLEACKPAKLCGFINCGNGDKIHKFNSEIGSNSWKNNFNASACLNSNHFDYGIYQNAVNLTQEERMATRYMFSLFWGFQQISTLAGNQTPSYFVPEVLFTMAIIGLGLLLFAFLIGNVQNFLQAPGKRRVESFARQRAIKRWMSYRRFPKQLEKMVLEAERYQRAITGGVNEETLLKDFPEDLQGLIRCHLFKFVKKVRVFAVMEDQITDAIYMKFRREIYLRGRKILHPDGLVDKMIFIARGNIESRGEDGVTRLCEGDLCGEELLSWCLDRSFLNKDEPKVRLQLLSNRTVTCITNVEAFVLRAKDLEEVIRLFATFLREPNVQGAIRYVSPYWRRLAATRIQFAWRNRKKRLSHADTSQSQHT